MSKKQSIEKRSGKKPAVWAKSKAAAKSQEAPDKPSVAKAAKPAAKAPVGPERPSLAPQGAEAAKGKPATAAKGRTLATDPRLPAPGTVIEKKDRHGAVRCECRVEEGGIRYAGKAYSSISSAALAAAKDLGLKNKTQNGYIFWGLAKPLRPAGDPVDALERAWERYRERAEGLATAGVTEEHRNKVAAALRKHVLAIEKLSGSSALKDAATK